MKIQTSEGFALTEQDTHYAFWKHLKEGGKLWRDDPLNGVKEVIRPSMFKNCIEITRYGYLNLTIIPKELECFYYDYLED